MHIKSKKYGKYGDDLCALKSDSPHPDTLPGRHRSVLVRTGISDEARNVEFGRLTRSYDE